MIDINLFEMIAANDPVEDEAEKIALDKIPGPPIAGLHPEVDYDFRKRVLEKARGKFQRWDDEYALNIESGYGLDAIAARYGLRRKDPELKPETDVASDQEQQPPTPEDERKSPAPRPTQ